MKRYLFPCPACGAPLEVPNLMRSRMATFVNSTTQCWSCGQSAPIPNGSYDFVGDVVTVLRGSTRQSIYSFRQIAVAAAEGQITAEEAEQQSAQLGETFRRVFVTSMQWGVPALLVAILALYIQWLTMVSDNDTDAQVAASLSQVTAALHDQAEINTAIKDELKTLKAIESGSVQPKPLGPKPRSSPRKPVGAAVTNRHERRRAEKLKRQRSKAAHKS